MLIPFFVWHGGRRAAAQVDSRNFIDGQIHDLSLQLQRATTGCVHLRLLVISPGWDAQNAMQVRRAKRRTTLRGVSTT